MKFLRRIFSGVKPSYLIRSYVIGFILFCLNVGILVFFLSIPEAKANDEFPTAIIIIIITYFFLCTLLFPFAKLVWDELRDLAFGSNIIIISALFLFMVKIFINIILWGHAPLIAPFGILYLWFRTRKPKEVMQD